MSAMTLVQSDRRCREGQGGPSPAVPRLVLADDVSEALGKKLEMLSSPYKDLRANRLTAFQAVVATLPRSVLEHLIAMRSDPKIAGALVLRNLPIDKMLPRTPADGGTSQEKTTFVSEGVLLGVASVLGIPFSFTREKDGVIIHSISPMQGNE